MTFSPRLPPLLLLLLTWGCVSVLSHDFERAAQDVPGLAPGMEQRADARASGASRRALPGVLRAVNRPFESWAPAGSGATAAFSMRLITLGRRN